MNENQSIALLENEPTDLMPSQPQNLSAMPVMDVAQAVERHKMFEDLVGRLLVKGIDYGKIPGTSQYALLKPGAEKLNVFFGQSPNMMLQESTQDWEKGFFHYRYRCDIWRGGARVAICEGSANSLEKKYRYIWADTDKKPGKPEAEKLKIAGIGRWRQNKGGWVWQERIENPNPYDLVNTLNKMAQKRAYVGATQMATGSTGFFANGYEVEDSAIDVEIEEQPTTGASAPSQNARQGRPSINSDKAEDKASIFWQQVKVIGLQHDDALTIANKAITGEITWEEAIKSLPR